MNSMTDQEWKVKEIRISFEKGYSCYEDERGVDRYEGWIVFDNKSKEEFKMNIDAISAEKYLGLMAESICQSANELAQKINNTVGLKKKHSQSSSNTMLGEETKQPPAQ